MAYGIQPKPGKVLFLLPTTSGTGSEVTPVAVLTDTRKNRKKGGNGSGVQGYPGYC